MMNKIRDNDNGKQRKMNVFIIFRLFTITTKSKYATPNVIKYACRHYMSCSSTAR